MVVALWLRLPSLSLLSLLELLQAGEHPETPDHRYSNAYRNVPLFMPVSTPAPVNHCHAALHMRSLNPTKATMQERAFYTGTHER